MTVRAGCDFSFARPSVDTLKAHGMTFVARYVSTPGASKNLTRAEVTAYQQAGIDICVVFETTGNRALSGTKGGAADARSALAQVLALGGPADCVIYFAVDWDASTAEMNRVNAYLAGAASVLGVNHTGVYGSYRCVQMALDACIVDYAWQTYAWSGGRWDHRAQLHQFRNGVDLPGGGQVDMCRAMTDDFGQWGRTAAHAEVEPMSAAELQALKDAIWDVRYKREGDVGHQDTNLETVVNKLDFLINAMGERLDTLDAAVAEIKAGL